MSVETVVQNDCSRLGLRVIHVMRVGEFIDADPYVAMVPTLAMETLRVYQRTEKLLGVRHLYLTWRAREALGMRLLRRSQFPVVVWWVARGETLRQAAGQAIYEYQMAYGDWPDAIWMRSVPSGAPDLAEVCGREMKIKQVDWGIAGFIVLGKEADYERSIND